MDDATLIDTLLNDTSAIAPTPQRASILHALAKLDGLEPGDPRYVAAIYPFDPPAEARQLALHQSGCGLMTEAGQRALPVDEPLLYVPVGPRSIAGGRQYPVALERDDAIRWGTWIDCAKWEPGKYAIAPADVMIIGCGGCPGVWSRNTFSSEHELTVAFVDSETGDVWSIDGGQPGIHVRRRRLVEVGTELWLGAVDQKTGACAIDPDGRPHVGRRVLGIIDADGYKVRLAA